MKRLFAIVCLIPSIANAGLFDDDVARQRIEEVRLQVVEMENRLRTLDSVQSAQISQASDIQMMKEELARLTGQVEVLTHNVDTLTRQQREFYNDLDARMRKLESQWIAPVPTGGASSGPAENPQNTSETLSTPTQQGEETANFDAALRLFEGAKYAASVRAFQNFLEYYPNSSLGPAAQFWIGNAYYAQQKDKEALAAYQKVVARWPANPKSAEALFSIARMQKEANQTAQAKKTLETLIKNYPNSPSAEDAKQLLKTF